MKMRKEEFLKWTEENNGHALTPMSQNTCLVFETNQGISLCGIDGMGYLDTPSQQVRGKHSYNYDENNTAAAAQHTEKLSCLTVLKGFKLSKDLRKKIQDSVLKKGLPTAFINKIITSARNRVSFSLLLTSHKSEIDRTSDILMNEFDETGCLYAYLIGQRLLAYNYKGCIYY
jgi:hypothetical protein